MSGKFQSFLYEFGRGIFFAHGVFNACYSCIDFNDRMTQPKMEVEL